MDLNICTTAQLREKEIINLCDGARLGYAEDFAFDASCGTITALLLPDRGLFRGGRCEPLYIPWGKIECLGEDTILVRLPANDPPYCDYLKRNAKKGRIL